MLSESKPRRADALRNADKIVEAALTQFSERGVDTSLDEIARKAGVGAGTLYRHFPTRQELIASTLKMCPVQLRATQDSLSESEDPLSALQEWLRIIREYVRTFDGLPGSLLQAVEEQNSTLSRICADMQDITEYFLTRAQQAGVARTEVNAHNLFFAQLAMAWVEDVAVETTTGGESIESLLERGYIAASYASAQQSTQ